MTNLLQTPTAAPERLYISNLSVKKCSVTRAPKNITTYYRKQKGGLLLLHNIWLKLTLEIHYSEISL